ncbi:MAG: DUF3418 domain-containing protein [Planctomycetota bacterium]|nr:MAG: DUF3418 domain-containing protein [Planctomycetota bacterium]
MRDPRERPLERQAAADAAHQRFADERSDFLGYLKLWDFFQNLKAKLSRSQLRRACRENFLSYNRLREWEDIYRQLLEIVRELGWKPGKRRNDYAAIHRALLTGLLANVAQRGRTHEYAVAAGGAAFLWPGSGLFDRRPAWVMAGELVETSRRYLRTVAEIDVDWIEPLAGHLVRRQYSEPHWSRKRGTAMAYERVSLFGLTIVPRRLVRYVPIDPETSRQLMIREGLVADRMDRDFEFLAHNREVIQRLEQARAKLRQQQPLPSEEELFAMYDRGIPSDVCDSRQLWTWWRRRATDEQKRALMLDPAQWRTSDDAPEQAFPDAVAVQHLRLPVSYAFQPGEDADGLTLRVPVEALGQLDERLLRWLVPGLLEENVTALIRSLPKALRRHFVPAPDTARQIARSLRFGEGDFLQVVATALQQIGGVPVGPEDFRLDTLPQHLRWNIEVVDADGQTLGRGRDLEALRRSLASVAREAAAAQPDDPQWHRDGITEWEWDELPESVGRQLGDSQVTVFPALLDRGDSVSLRLLDSEARAGRETLRGVRRLYWLIRRRQVGGAVQTLPNWSRLKLQAVGLPDAGRLERTLEELIVQRAYLHDGKVPRSRTRFEARLQTGDQRLPVAVQEVAGLITQLLPAYHQAVVRLEELAASKRTLFAPTVEDVRTQIAALVAEGFLTETPWGWLQQFPRYFRAIRYRLDKVAAGEAGRDRRLLQQYRPFEERFRQRQARLKSLGIEDPQLVEYRWMLEEYRVSLFAQPLGTAVKVSPVRLERLWNRLRPIG